MRTYLFTAVLGASLLLSGCGNHYMLKSKFVMASQLEAPPEIIVTQTYRSEAAKIRTVAVKAPDSCSNRTADERTGGAVSREAVLKTNCGVEMAEIERALSRASYKVISWNVLAREMEGKNLSALQVAANSGAQLLFQINSLEKSTKNIGKEARWERTFYESNADGDTLEAKSFNEETRDYFKRTFLDRFESSVNLRRLAVTLDANAVSVKDGEAIWFYRWTHIDPTAANYEKKQLIYCKKERECFHDSPANRGERVKTDTITAGESEAISDTEKPEDIEKALYDSMLKAIVDNLVSSFAQYQKK